MGFQSLHRGLHDGFSPGASWDTTVKGLVSGGIEAKPQVKAVCLFIKSRRSDCRAQEVRHPRPGGPVNHGFQRTMPGTCAWSLCQAPLPFRYGYKVHFLHPGLMY